MRKGILLAILLAAVSSRPLPAQPQKKGALPEEARVKSAINLFVELNNFLLVNSQGDQPARPEYLSEITAYSQARELIQNQASWRLVYDACIEGPDIGKIAARADALPEWLPPSDREGVAKVLRALGSAWPRFESHEGMKRTRSLQSALVRNLRRSFSAGIEPRVMPFIYEKMGFQPLDRPVTLYPVIDALEAGTWGRTPSGYYLLLPVAQRPNLVIVENIIHELTHVIDLNQPHGSKSFLRELREKGRSSDPAALEEMIHGLIAWTAGDVIKRFVNEDYTPLTERAPERQMLVKKYLPTYEGAWTGYLDGRLTRQQAIEGMISALGPAAGPDGR